MSLNFSASHVRSIVFGLLIGALVALSFGFGFIMRDVVATIPMTDTSEGQTAPYAILDEVQNLIANVYLRPLPDDTALEYAAIRGMLSSLNDPATLFIDPPVAQSESHALAGTYGGIGVLVKRVESGEFALFPYIDSPAYNAGVRDHDVLVSINGAPITVDMAIDAIDQLLRGEVVDDNGVIIQTRNLDGQINEFSLIFDVINIPSVISRLAVEDDAVGYMQILRFTSRTPTELIEQLTELESLGISALILDLRDNSGGLLIESIEVADHFLDAGIIVIEKSRDDEKVFSAEAGNYLPEVPIVILVNNRTASASELVAGALRDNGRGVLMGQHTFGKGTVQQIFPLQDGSSVHITSAEWLTPARESIASNGLEPDMVLIPDESGRDVEYGEAIRYLQSVLDQ